MTPEEYFKIELVKKQLKLDRFIEKQIVEIRSVFTKASENMLAYSKKKITAAYGEGGWTRDRYLKILQGFSKTDEALKSGILSGTLASGELAYSKELKAFEKVLSVGGIVPGFKEFKLTPQKIKAYYEHVDIGGPTLKKWVDKTFTSEIQNKIKNEIMSGALVGDSYGVIERRLAKAYSHIDKTAIETLVRTHIQSANNRAFDDVSLQNKHLVREVRWLATIDIRCCPACGCMDGRVYSATSHPMLPNHPRCRCCWVWITKTWKDLGVDQKEITKRIRPDNMDRGIAKQTKKTFPEKFNTEFTEKQKLDLIGPGRKKYLDDGLLDFEDLVNQGTGDLYLIKDLDMVVERKTKTMAMSATLEKKIRAELAKKKAQGAKAAELKAATEKKWEDKYVGFQEEIREYARSITEEEYADLKVIIKDLKLREIPDIKTRYKTAKDALNKFKKGLEIPADDIKYIDKYKEAFRSVEDYLHTNVYDGYDEFIARLEEIKWSKAGFKNRRDTLKDFLKELKAADPVRVEIPGLKVNVEDGLKKLKALGSDTEYAVASFEETLEEYMAKYANDNIQTRGLKRKLKRLQVNIDEAIFKAKEWKAGAPAREAAAAIKAAKIKAKAAKLEEVKSRLLALRDKIVDHPALKFAGNRKNKVSVVGKMYTALIKEDISAALEVEKKYVAMLKKLDKQTKLERDMFVKAIYRKDQMPSIDKIEKAIVKLSKSKKNKEITDIISELEKERAEVRRYRFKELTKEHRVLLGKCDKNQITKVEAVRFEELCGLMWKNRNKDHELLDQIMDWEKKQKEYVKTSLWKKIMPQALKDKPDLEFNHVGVGASRGEKVTTKKTAIAKGKAVTAEGKKVVKKLLHGDVLEQVPKLDIDYVPNERAHYSGYNAEIFMGGDETATFVHEFGHAVEENTVGIKDKAMQFLKKRAGNEKPSKIYPNRPELAEEVGYKDEFFNHYCGKIYKDGDTELVSMGLEMMYEDPVGFLKSDKEYFTFIVEVMWGVL